MKIWINFIFKWWKQCFMNKRSCFHHSKIKLTSSRHHVLFFLWYRQHLLASLNKCKLEQDMTPLILSLVRNGKYATWVPDLILYLFYAQYCILPSKTLVSTYYYNMISGTHVVNKLALYLNHTAKSSLHCTQASSWIGQFHRPWDNTQIVHL